MGSRRANKKRKKKGYFDSCTLQKKHYFAHEYLFSVELVGIDYFRVFIFYDKQMNLN